MPRTRVTITYALAAAILSVLLVGSISVAGADEPSNESDPRSVSSLEVYTRTTAYGCTSEFTCFIPTVIAKCKSGDRATGGAAWWIEFGNPLQQDFQSRPWRKNGKVRGWKIDDGHPIEDGDIVRVQVVCVHEVP